MGQNESSENVKKAKKEKTPALDVQRYLITNGQFKLSERSTKDKQGLTKKQGQTILKENQQQMAILQEKLYAENKQSLLIIFQAMDAAGKDGCIKHVMVGLNPQGTHVTAFKQPSSEELDHDYLWRHNRALPRRGEIGIFNRSQYEEVVVTQLHRLITNQQLPDQVISKHIWDDRYAQIASWEEYLNQQGTRILKFFLHISKEEQRKRLLDRINEKEKNWKFSAGDIAEREHWEEYQDLYEKAIQKTATKYSPWIVVPSDHKWFARSVVSQVILDTLKEMNPQIPTLSKKETEELSHWKKVLEQQKPKD